MSSQNTPLDSHSCLVYTAAGVSIEIHISLTLFTQVKCVARSQCAAEGELALHWLAFCLWLCLIEIEDHDGAVGEFCWELEALWGCSLDELAAGAAVAYC